MSRMKLRYSIVTLNHSVKSIIFSLYIRICIIGSTFLLEDVCGIPHNRRDSLRSWERYAQIFMNINRDRLSFVVALTGGSEGAM